MNTISTLELSPEHEPWRDNWTSSRNGVPLCVDLDGTLIRTDLLVESIFVLIKKSPGYLFLFPIWLLNGKAYFKRQIADRVDLEVASLPYNQEFVDYLREQSKEGRLLILVTGSNVKFAQHIAKYLNIFQQVMASNEQINLTGHKKAERLVSIFGEKKFDYAGNDRSDLSVWAHSRQAIIVNPKARLKEAVVHLTELGRVFEDGKKGMRVYLGALRLHQWTKNLLVFLPLIAAHKLSDLTLLVSAVYAFFAFSLCASGIYLLNDLFDIPADREHPRKRYRALAAGSLSSAHAMSMATFLVIGGISLAFALPIKFMALLAAYLGISFTYSVWLKKVVLLDVIALASVYTLRILGGGAAVSIEPSFWLLALSVFLFLSLAMVKRYSELQATQRIGKLSLRARGYVVEDLETLAGLGQASGYMAVLVLGLYINGDMVRNMYSHPMLLWFLCLVLLYWISRVWIIARRGQMHDDPVVFAIRDRISLASAIAALGVLTLAI
jgi:4-hydroxybenzoate polyprenyltransferase